VKILKILAKKTFGFHFCGDMIYICVDMCSCAESSETTKSSLPLISAERQQIATPMTACADAKDQPAASSTASADSEASDVAERNDTEAEEIADMPAPSAEPRT